MGVLLAAIMLVTGVGVAHADPDKVEEAKAELEKLEEAASNIDQEIIEATARADEAKVKLTQLEQDLAVQQQKVDELTQDLGDIAGIAMATRGMHLTAQLVTSSDENSFLTGLAVIQNEASRTNSQVQAVQVEQGRLDSLRAEADAVNKQLAADLKAKQELAASYDAKVAEAEAVYNRLNAEEQARLRRLEREREARRQAEQRRREQAAARANRGSESRPAATQSQSSNQQSEQSSSESSGGESSGGNSSRAQKAVDIALAQVGKRYSWGSSGPNSFDCSGLMRYAYGKVGISLSRSSRAQSRNGRRVSIDNLRPGDLVFYYSPISHVGMYIGNGKIVHAANPRRGVRVASLHSMPIATARRVS
ncbi:MAG: hypothetical protein CSA64_01955 [Arachnia propionica]|nr:MAG: hypothetical protein CSA64_01955 [Arachnia propionica]